MAFSLPQQEISATQKSNLARMAKHIAKISPLRFSMESYRIDGGITPECKTIGCVLGHSIILDDFDDVPINEDSMTIEYYEWGKKFTGLGITDMAWHYLFSPRWSEVDNTPSGASKRILKYLDGGVPSNWNRSMI